jgi:hypothetical protein
MTVWQRICCGIAQLLVYVVLATTHTAWRTALALGWVRTGLKKRVLDLAAPQQQQPCEVCFRPRGEARAVAHVQQQVSVAADGKWSQPVN